MSTFLTLYSERTKGEVLWIYTTQVNRRHTSKRVRIFIKETSFVEILLYTSRHVTLNKSQTKTGLKRRKKDNTKSTYLNLEVRNEPKKGILLKDLAP